MIKLIGLFSILFFVGCVQKPTKSIEESVNVYAENTVLVDTRSAFEFASYHIQGSVNLNTADFLILKDTRKKTRMLDPDLSQTIERLAKRGISPNKRVILLSENSDIESKKWSWLLKNLEVENIQLMTMKDFKKNQANRRFAEPASEPVWVLKSSEDLQKEFIFKKAKDCFVNWSDKKCGRE